MSSLCRLSHQHVDAFQCFTLLTKVKNVNGLLVWHYCKLCCWSVLHIHINDEGGWRHSNQLKYFLSCGRLFISTAFVTGNVDASVLTQLMHLCVVSMLRIIHVVIVQIDWL